VSQVFKDLVIEWGRNDYKVDAGRRFDLICALENHVAIGEIAMMANDPARMRATSLANGFAAILRFVGVTEVRDGKTVPIGGEAVFGLLFGGAAEADRAMAAVMTLMAIIQPDAAVEKPNGG